MGTNTWHLSSTCVYSHKTRLHNLNSPVRRRVFVQCLLSVLAPLLEHIVDIYRRQACSHTRPVYINRILFLNCSTYLPADSPVESQGKPKWIQSSCCLCYGCGSTFMSNWDTFVASDDTKVFRLRHRRRRFACSLTASLHSLKSDAFTSWSSLVFLWLNESRFFPIDAWRRWRIVHELLHGAESLRSQSLRGAPARSAPSSLYHWNRRGGRSIPRVYL